MSFDREYQALSKLGRYKRILIYGTGIAMSGLALLACALASLSVVREYLAQTRQNFVINRGFVVQELADREQALRAARIGAELAWRGDRRADAARVRRLAHGPASFRLPSSSDVGTQWVFSATNVQLTSDEARRYLRFAMQLGEAGAVGLLERDRSTTAYFVGLQHPVAGILSVLPHRDQGRLKPDSLIARLRREAPQAMHATARGERGGDGPRTEERVTVHWMNPAPGLLTGRPVLRLATTARRSGAPLAAIVVEYDPQRLAAPLRAGVGHGTYRIVSADGTRLASVPPAVGESRGSDRVAPPGSSGGTWAKRGGEYAFTLAEPLGDSGLTLAFVLPLRALATAVGMPLAANVLLTLGALVAIWTCLLVFKRHYFRRALEQSRKVFESEHLSRTLIETAPVGLGLISADSGRLLLGNPCLLDTSRRVATRRFEIGQELVQRHRARDSEADEAGVHHEQLTLPTTDGDEVVLSVSTARARYRGEAVLVAALRDTTVESRLECQLREARRAADAANAAKSVFLATMTHEIRTPLNAILGNLELLEHAHLDAWQRDRLHTICTSSESLSAIVNDVLDLSKVEAGEMHFECIEFDALDVITRALTIFEPLARKKGIRLRGVPCLDTTLPMCGDPTRIGQIINNLLSNALKFTEAGEVTLHVAVRRDAGVAPVLDIEVADTGIGISDEQQGRLFRPFSQVDASMGRRFGGTGLGLALCARLTEAMGGSIAVRSRPGNGSRFTVRLPVGTPRAEPDRPRFAGEHVVFVAAHDAEHACVIPVLRAWGLTVRALRRPAQVDAATIRAAAALILCGPRGTWHVQEERSLVDHAARVIDIGVEKPCSPVLTERVISVSSYSPKGWATALRHALYRESLKGDSKARVRPAPPRRLKVLVAEDHAVNRWLLAEQLALLGCDAHGVGNGEQALTRLASTRYDVLLSDLQMPGMDGLALIRRVRAQWPSMPVVVVTADLTPQRRVACEAAGASEAVGKPLSLDALASVLARCCGAPDETPANAGEDGWLGGRALPESIRAMFLASYEASCAEIRAAWKCGDTARALAQLHTLRGAAGVFRLKALAARCSALEARIDTEGLGAIAEADVALPLDDPQTLQ